MDSAYLITCECGYSMQVTAEYFGRTGRCPKCNRPIRVAPAAVDTMDPEAKPASSRPRVSTPGAAGGEAADWQAGEVILDLYKVLGVLGEGGMGKVYRVHHRTWNIDLAVKSPKPGILQEAGGFENFERECETWINLGLHPHIVSCYYVRQIGSIPRIFAEYVAGGSLWNWLEKGILYNAGPERALERIVGVAIQIAWGLHHAHEQGLVHRDVKSANVMMTKSGAAKVTDFGLAKALASRKNREVQAAAEAAADQMGQPAPPKSAGGMTPAYCSPEQRRAQDLTHATDIWSWGLIVLEMLAGRVYWRLGTEAPKALEYMLNDVSAIARVPHVPGSMAELLRQCFQVDPGARPASLFEAAEALQAAFEDIAGRPYPRKAPRSVEGRAESLNNRAVSFMDLGKEKDAKRYWREALERTPQHAESTYNLELQRWRDGKISDDALLYRLREVAIAQPGAPLPNFLTAQIHLERGDWQAAIMLLEEIKDNDEYGPGATALLKVARERYRGSRRLLRTFKGHADLVHAVLIWPDGQHAVSGSEDNTIRLWDMTTGECRRFYEGHYGAVTALAASPDGAHLVSGSKDRTIRLWDAASGRCVQVFEGHEGALTALALDRTGETILAADAECMVRAWRVGSEHPTRAFKGHTGPVSDVSLSPDGARAATSSQDGAVRIWDAKSGRLLRQIDGHEGPVTGVCLSQDGRFVVSCGADHVLRLASVDDGRCLRVFEGHRDAVHSVVMSFDGKYLVSGGKDATVRLWETAAGRCLHTFERHTEPVNAVGVNQEGTLIVSGGQDNTVRLWSMGSSKIAYRAPLMLCRALESEKAVSIEAAFQQTLRQAQQALAQHNSIAAAAYVRKARALPGYKRKADAVREWMRLYRRLPKHHLENAWEGAVMRGHRGAVTAVRVTPDGHHAVSGGADGALRYWETATGQCLQTIETGASSISSLSLAEDGRAVLTTNQGGAIAVWDMLEGVAVRAFETVGVSIEAAALRSDARFAVSVGWETNLWDVATGRPIRTLKGHNNPVSVFWSRDGQLLLTGGAEGDMCLWDAANAAIVRRYTGLAGAVRCVYISADGRYILCASNNPWEQNSELGLYELDSTKQVMTFPGHSGVINSAVLSEDNRFVLSGAADNAVKLWDAATGQCLRSFESHRETVESVALARDARFVISASADGALRSWVLDWELADKPLAAWDKAAQPQLNSFCVQHAPPAGDLEPDRPPTEKELVKALSRRGHATWTDDDFNALMRQLGCAGYGWLTPDGVFGHLQRTARKAGSISFVPRRSARLTSG